MKNSKCKESELLSAYIDGQMDGQQLRLTAIHITQCSKCSEELAGLIKVRSMLTSLATPSEPPISGFWANAYRAARLKQFEHNGQRSRELPLLLQRKPLICSVAVVACCAVALPFVNPSVFLSRYQPAFPSSHVSIIDIAPLIQAHTTYSAVQPLVDDSHVSMILSDETADKDNLPADDQANVANP